MSRNPYLYLFLMAAATYAVRVLPLTLLKRRITNPILHSFLYYVPYVTLAVMTFPPWCRPRNRPFPAFWRSRWARWWRGAAVRYSWWRFPPAQRCSCANWRWGYKRTLVRAKSTLF